MREITDFDFSPRPDLLLAKGPSKLREMADRREAAAKKLALLTIRKILFPKEVNADVTVGTIAKMSARFGFDAIVLREMADAYFVGKKQ